MPAPEGPTRATTAEIGAQLMTNYIFPFEYVSLVLLAAMVGAAILIRERSELLDRANARAALGLPAGLPDDHLLFYGSFGGGGEPEAARAFEITTRAVRAGDAEVARNPRSRSAVLRAAEKRR